MFDTLITLITIAIWAVAIFLFVGGIILCVGDLISGNGWKKLKAAIAILLGIYVFYKMYIWLDSMVWCFLGAGFVLGLISEIGSGEQAPQKEKKYGFGDAYLDAYCEYELQKQATKDAIRELEERR